MADAFMAPDLQLSAFLVALGHQPIRIEGTLDRRFFVFAGVPQKDVTVYYRGDATTCNAGATAPYSRLD